MEDPKMREKKRTRSVANGNLGNPLKKKSNETTKKTNLFNQITVTEAMPQRFNLSRCQVEEKSALPLDQYCKGKSVVKSSNNATALMDIGQAMGIFQEEIIMEILSRLPVRSLHRFKCVSKFWNALISDPHFKKMHLNRAKFDESFYKLLTLKEDLEGYNLYSSSLLPGQMVEDEQKHDFPWNFRPSCTLLCSCDGLVLFATFEGLDEHLLLWNPSTKESITLPPPKILLKYCVWGLGYDTTTDDYKILAIELDKFDFIAGRVSVEILALKSGSWRILEYPYGIRRACAYSDCGMDSLAFVHGAFHWHAIKRNCVHTVMSFDISNEVYGEIPITEEVWSYSRLDGLGGTVQGVSELVGRLCFYASACNNPGMGTCKMVVWVMKDYGIKESWMLLLRILDTSFMYAIRPKYWYTDGEVLLHCRVTTRPGRVCKRSWGAFGLWPSELVAMKSVVFIESLISPKLLTT